MRPVLNFDYQLILNFLNRDLMSTFSYAGSMMYSQATIQVID